jgi:hypothetical protein
MLTAEIKINGALIVHIYAVNERELNDIGETKYRYEIYRPDSPIRTGEVHHLYGDGAASLIHCIIEDSWKEK